ncbi:Ca2+-binding protein, RTX toxin-related [Rhizobium sp. NFR07]|uniref:tandem-95 repeat protein n=1 Tax=Rhizobium sp. NFR07 TaxID=1566262 RepID=UPI0008EEFB42|nr:tandem-95 repeat protein [Rhizobium sp. NFR07]SFB15712.1 Ca2+-binding protein, RTX toxin-related [Rhizobium sp. NFR07]
MSLGDTRASTTSRSDCGTISISDILLENNTAYDNGHGATGGAGVVVQRSDIFPEGENTIPWVTDVRIIGGEYYGNSREGILIKLSDDVEVSGVSVHDNMRQGIRVEGATNSDIHGNEIYNNSRESAGVYDEINIRLRLDDVVDPPRTYYSEDTRIYDNDIHSDGGSRYGIREELTNSTAGNPSGTVVYGNTVTGTASGAVYVPPYSVTEGDDYLYGTTSADSFAGLGGNDTYIVNHSGDTVLEQANAGNDTVIASLNYTLSANVENLALTGSAVRGTGNDLANYILGNAANNELEGLGGDDILDGGAGADTMQGGDGNDTYYVDNALDVIIEKDHAGLGGYDTVYSTVSYGLAAEVEKLVLQGTSNLNATGNVLANELVGNSGDNILDGQGGADTMRGALGNDTYIVDHTGDMVIELAGQGIDTVRSSLTYTLGDNVENLVLTGSGQRDATGNALGNVIIGNDGANKIHGMDGDDIIEGGLGADQLYGDAGNDTFVLRKGEFQGDVIEDFSGNGTALGDRIQFTGFSASAVLVNIGGDSWQVQDGAHVETFRIKVPVGQAAFDLSDYSFDGAPPPSNSAPVASSTGNSINGQEDVVVTGNVPTGADADGDALSYALVAPVTGLTFNTDGTFSFAPPANQNGDFTFQYVVKDVRGAQSAPQTFTIALAAVNDAPVASATGNSLAGTEDMVASGSVPAAADVEGGPLTYRLVNAVAGLSFNADGSFVFTPAANANGNFTFQYVAVDAQGLTSAAQTFTIALAAVNDAPVAAATGNAAAGNANTVISGHLPTGMDIEGHALTYLQIGALSGLSLSADGSFTFTPAGNASGDFTFQYLVKDALGAESAPQTFTIALSPPASGLIVTGNNSANTLHGGAGNDVIDGGQGADTMYGYAGNDTYYVDSSKDKVVEAAGEGTDTVITTASFTLEDTVFVEIVQASGTSAVTLKGNASANTLIGNSAANTINGNDGDDILDGGLGNDALTGGNGRDTFVFSTALGANNIDQIKDFKVVDDTIMLSRSVFSALSAGTLSQASFVKGSQALDASDHIIYDSNAGQLLYDADGAGGAAAVVFATIGKGLQIDYLDFVVRDEPIA